MELLIGSNVFYQVTAEGNKMRITREELEQRLRAAGLTVGCNTVINPRDGYAIGFIELKQWNFNSKPVIYEIEKLYCSDVRYVFKNTGYGMFNQMVNEYGYHQRSVKKNDLDGFIAVCKEFIEWVNVKYPREAVLKKEQDDEKLRERVAKSVAKLKRSFRTREKKI